MTRSRSSTLSTNPAPIPSTFTDGLALPPVLVFDLDYTLWPFWVDTHCTGPLKPASSPTPHTPKARTNNDTQEPSYNKSMIDRYGEHFSFYDQVPTVLAAAAARGITMSVASRTHAPDMAQTMLRGLYVPPLHPQQDTTTATTEPSSPEPNANANSVTKPPNPLPLPNPSHPHPLRALDFFTAPQMYPGDKTKHFTRIQAALRKQGHGEIPYADMVFFDDEARNRNVERELGAVFVLVLDGLTSAEVDRGVKEWRRRRGILAPSNASAQAADEERATS